jgi:ABC-2 type transport system permease protein
MLRKMSGGQGSLVDVFFGTELRFLAIGVAAYGITTALRLHGEENAGRAEVVLAGPVSRLRWLSSHAVIAVLGSTWLLVVVGVCAGASAAASSNSGIGDLLTAALATLPAVLVCIAIAVALFGFVPRYAQLAWAALAAFVLLGELGALLKLPDWMLALSPFDHLGSLPGGDSNPVGLVGLLVVASAVGALGATAFRRRDIAT